MKRVIIGTGSHSYGSREIPSSVFYKLKKQESQCYNSVQGWKPEKGRRWHPGVSPRVQRPHNPELQYLISESERRMHQLKKREREFLCLCVLFRPAINWRLPAHTGEGLSLLGLLILFKC